MKKLIKKIQSFFKSQNDAATKKPNYLEAALSHPKTPTKETLLKLIDLEQREQDLVTQIIFFKESLKDTSHVLFVRSYKVSGSGLWISAEESKPIAKLAIQSAERDLAEVRKQISEIKLQAFIRSSYAKD